MSERPSTRSFCRLLIELNLPHPFWRYLELFGDDQYCFLLDSGMDPAKLGRYSFLGGEPALVFSATRRRNQSGPAEADITLTRLRDNSGKLLLEPEDSYSTGDPFTALRNTLAEFSPADDGPPDSPFPFFGGAVGYFGYETGYCCEVLPDRGRDDLQLPDLAWLLVDVVVAHCHRSGRSWLAVTARGENDNRARANAHCLRDRWLQRLTGFQPQAKTNPGSERSKTVTQGPDNHLPINTHFDRASYGAAVEKARDHIFSGDVFEVCLTHRFDVPLSGRPWDLYRQLRAINPAPFAAYLGFPDFQVVSASPERFLRLGRDRIVESRPIKGTRPRGTTATADARLRRELAESAKDRAENVMIVDLVRNDLGRVAKIGSVQVPELLTVESYATVFQLVSTIRAELADQFDALDLVQASFPGGSMTGAPKIAAMQIIDSIEPIKRGIYAGAIGYLDQAGAMDLNIVIRTIICCRQRAYLGIGGAIVADSEPDQEYEETLDKARALLAALREHSGAAGQEKTFEASS